MSSKEKIVFLDRDGTLIRDYPDKTWSNIETAEFLSNIKQGLQLFAENGYSFIIVTNQYIIGDGYITTDDYLNINQQVEQFFIKNNFNLNITLYCPHKKSEHCLCHKPNNQLFHIANALYNIDIENSLMIGDSDADLGFANKSNLKFYRTNTETTILDIANEYFNN